MASPRGFWSLIFGLSLGAATAALAIAFLLIVVAAQPRRRKPSKLFTRSLAGRTGESRSLA